MRELKHNMFTPWTPTTSGLDLDIGWEIHMSSSCMEKWHLILHPTKLARKNSTKCDLIRNGMVLLLAKHTCDTKNWDNISDEALNTALDHFIINGQDRSASSSLRRYKGINLPAQTPEFIFTTKWRPTAEHTLYSRRIPFVEAAIDHGLMTVCGVGLKWSRSSSIHRFERDVENGITGVPTVAWPKLSVSFRSRVKSPCGAREKQWVQCIRNTDKNYYELFGGRN
ncbi:hypothetical protein C8R44DRAFT_725925 [Mycena epipterygia]|nr:hypothetical protein C8R44DRAFT_725925 [Mycena epipterygia]